MPGSRNKARPESPSPEAARHPPLLAELAELAMLFLLLGLTGFGGPTAHLVRMRALFVDQRRWLDADAFALTLGAANLIPGPTSTEVALHIGMRRAGLPGLMVAGICFIAPAAVLCGSLAALAPELRSTPMWRGAVTATSAGVVSLLAIGFPAFAKPLLKTRSDVVAAAVGAIGTAMGVDPLWTLFGIGLIVAGFRFGGAADRKTYAIHGAVLFAVALSLVYSTRLAVRWVPSDSGVANVGTMFAEFAAIGSSLYGNGNLLLAFADERLVHAKGWVDPATLREAIAVGQATPGPVFAMASYLGMRIAGIAGAWSATTGIFLPAFLLVAMSSHLLERMRRSEALLVFLAGLNAASVGTMAIVVAKLAHGVLFQWIAWVVLVPSVVLMARTRVNVAWVIIGCAVLGGIGGWLIPWSAGR